MRRLLLVFGLLLLISLPLYYFYPRTVELNGAYVSSQSILGVTDDSDEEIAVSCVLSYGTFFVSQKQCDELTAFDNGEKNEPPVSCTLDVGTFLVSEKECQILKAAKGSRDIVKPLE